MKLGKTPQAKHSANVLHCTWEVHQSFQLHMCIKGPRGGNASSHCSHSSPQPLSWGGGGGWQWLLIRALCANTRRGASSCRWKRGGRNQRNRLQMQRNVAASLRSLCCCSPSLRGDVFAKEFPVSKEGIFCLFVCLFSCPTCSIPSTAGQERHKS